MIGITSGSEMDDYVTPYELAAETGASPQYIRRLARELGLEVSGYVWLFSPAQVKRIKERIRPRGRPRLARAFRDDEG